MAGWRVLAVSLICASGAAAQDAKLPELTPERIQSLFKANCANCHGDKGAGDGAISASLVPRPRDFAEGDFKVRSTQSGDIPTDGDLEKVIKRGMPGTAMPAFAGRLSTAEIKALVDLVKSFSDRFDQDGPGVPLTIPKAPPQSRAMLMAGQKLFIELACISCHGFSGKGDGPRAGQLSDDRGLPSKPRDLRAGDAYKGGSSVEDIYRTLATGLDGSPMTALHHGIGDEQRWQLAWYVHNMTRTNKPAPKR